MVWRSLIPHADFPPPVGIDLTVTAERSGGALRLLYRIAGDNGGERVQMPPPGMAGRTDELWTRTCFEAFIRVDGRVGYHELNFSPSGEWAAYSFDGYRTGMRPLIGPVEPLAGLAHKGELADGGYGWRYSTIDIFDPKAEWRMGLSAVIEAIDGTTSYWALAHAPGPPDFHNPDCFVARLPAPTAP